ncbi:MAG: D-sedoheptulose 7-phosphate isomerase [Nitrospinaceae bacterium]|nr:MAG: D-sedoheptulose 7-phosphate isomerase [Nitrospinaceae bacterium]
MERIRKFLLESSELKRQVADTLAADILKAAEWIYDSLQGGGKLLLMGNGGSAADCQHIAAELVGRYKKERAALPAIALTVDTSSLTAIGNDYGFDAVFSRQVEALARPGDVLLGISTSGNSENILRAFQRANEMQVTTIALLGKGGGKAHGQARLALVVPSADTARIQEVHITIGHILCELIEDGV